jgi:hypothetical protein
METSILFKKDLIELIILDFVFIMIIYNKFSFALQRKMEIYVLLI